MRLTASIIAFGALVYVGLVGALYVFQERFIFPAPVYVTPPLLIEDFNTVTITTPDGEKLYALHRKPVPGAPTILIFHGNADSAIGQLAKGRLLAQSGFGVLAVEYRGYPGSTGKPTEKGLTVDAEAAYDYAIANGGGPIGLYAHSLGTGVALQLATSRPVLAIVLEAPYDSIEAVARNALWWAPVRALLRHPFRSDVAIEQLQVPILVLHGTRDRVVPIAHGRALAAKGGADVTFREIQGASHYLFSSGTGAPAVRFLREHL